MALFRRKKQTTNVLETNLFPADETMNIVSDEALAAALKLCHLQRKIWDELIVTLDDMGIRIGIDSEIADEINSAIRSLQAADEIAFEIYEMENQ